MVTAQLQQVIITDTDGLDGSTMADPASNAPESDVGTQSLQPASNVPTFVQNQSLFDGSAAAPIGGGPGAGGVFLNGSG